MNLTRTLPRCPPGKYYSSQPPPDKVSDRGWCYNCRAGTYSDEHNRDIECKSCTVCSQEMGLVEEQPCQRTADTLCRCREQSVMDHGGCKQTEASISRRTTTEADKKLPTAEPTNTPGNLGIHRAYVTPVEEVKKSSRRIHVSYDAKHEETTAVLGVNIHTQMESASVILYLGSIPVTTAMLPMGTISLVTIAALTIVTVTLCLKRKQRTCWKKRQSIEVSLQSDYHLYEDPEALIPHILPHCNYVAASASEAPGCASQNLDHTSSPNSSENSVTPLLDQHMSAGASSPAYGDIKPPAYRDVEHTHASNREENTFPSTDLARTVTIASCSADYGFRKNFTATENCITADGVDTLSATSANVENCGLIGAAAAILVAWPASAEIREPFGGGNKSKLACKRNAEAITADVLQDGGYIYSPTWGQLRSSPRPL